VEARLAKLQKELAKERSRVFNPAPHTWCVHAVGGGGVERDASDHSFNTETSTTAIGEYQRQCPRIAQQPQRRMQAEGNRRVVPLRSVLSS